MWEYEGKKYLALHGDRFDPYLINNRLLNKILSRVYALIAYAGVKNLRFSAKQKTPRTQFYGLTKHIAKAAAMYAYSKDVDVIFCGHTHDVYAKSFQDKNKKKVEYYNTGSWTHLPATFVTVSGEGVEINEYSPQKPKHQLPTEDEEDENIWQM
jgi:UDP-2,3-diacylglucosamine pyrophosphatase LpxH